MINDEKNFNLLLELIKLYKKYGTESFSELSRLLNDKNFINTFNKVLDKSSIVAKEKGINAEDKKPKKINFKDELLLMSQTDKQKSEILLNIYNKLQSKTVFNTNKHLIHFASEIGLNLTASARNQNIRAIMKTLMQFSIDKLLEIEIQFENLRNDGDRSLDSWSNIILNKNYRTAN